MLLKTQNPPDEDDVYPGGSCFTTLMELVSPAPQKCDDRKPKRNSR
jgi:hypothetical protein